MTVSEVARALMIPAAYAWVVAESLAGLVTSASAEPGLGAFYDSRCLLISNQELTDIAPGNTCARTAHAHRTRTHGTCACTARTARAAQARPT